MSGWRHRLFVALACGCGLQACVSDSSSPGPQSLGSAQVPPGFTFQAIRPVQVSISASPSLLPAGAFASVEISRPDGALLYRGPLTSSRPLQLSLPLASKDHQLRARLTGLGASEPVTLEVAGDAATHSFQ